MDNDRKLRLENYFKNSSRFLWGLGIGNQGVTYNWLRGKGYQIDDKPYAHVTAQLLKDPGVEAILKDVIIPRVKELFPVDALNHLRIYWQEGRTPDVGFLKVYGTKQRDEFPFLEVNSQYNYVERWGELAGIWFEEIEKEEVFEDLLSR